MQSLHEPKEFWNKNYFAFFLKSDYVLNDSHIWMCVCVYVCVYVCVCVCIYIYIYVYIHTSSSSTTCAASMDSIYSFLLSIPIIYHHSQQVLLPASTFHTELMNITLCGSDNTGVAMCGGLHQNFAYEFILNSPAVPSMLCSSFLDDLWDGR